MGEVLWAWRETRIRPHLFSLSQHQQALCTGLLLAIGHGVYASFLSTSVSMRACVIDRDDACRTTISAVLILLVLYIYSWRAGHVKVRTVH